MTISVHTNNSALVALQNLNKTNDKLADVQSRINTGLKVSGPKDNASVWAVAQGQRADVGALSAVKMSLDRATSMADVAMAAGESISDLLNQVKEKVVAGMDPSIDTASRNALNSDYKALLRQISQVVATAEFDGANILDGSLAANITFLANADATAFVTLGVKNFSLGGAFISMGAASSIATKTMATNVLGQLNNSIAAVNAALGDLGAQARQIEAHNTFVSKLTDVLESGIGNLVDADLARESARLQALQVQQQLGAQALSIANQAPQVILSLFKG
ncbi:flagellin [Caulobacter sp. 17J80-11]|jgi:flagellin|uniref:flagellin n=1 Tax=Caulobacter sp. 17J80-11 TaxID=2763502 RepID=UPI0016538AD4|nr:flagellin [Caulobacter sp. 17J80-11]MBC6980601.1 flagellin [Caulobacter sp. 17J80-11]